jgi:hypothetical protein
MARVTGRAGTDPEIRLELVLRSSYTWIGGMTEALCRGPMRIRFP